MAPIELCLPYPPSANRYWRTFVPRGSNRAITHVSTEAQEFKKAVALQCRLAGVIQPIQGRVELEYWLFPQRPQDWKKRKDKDARWDDSIRCLDLDNCTKVLFDSLKGIAFEDDKMVFGFRADRQEPDDDGPRLIVRIQSWEPTEDDCEGPDFKPTGE